MPAEHVGLELRAHRLHGNILDRSRLAEAAVVEQRVEAAGGPLEDFIQGRVDAPGVRQVKLKALVTFGRESFDVGRAPRGGEGSVASVAQRIRRDPSDAAGAAGDQDRPGRAAHVDSSRATAAAEVTG